MNPPGIPPNYVRIGKDEWCEPTRLVRARSQTVDNGEGLRTVQPQPDERLPLDPVVEGEEASGNDAPCGFEIVFTVYSRRPCDWDGYDIKALQDFLITAGIIPDDGWRTLSGRVVSRKAATQAEEKTIIEICALKS